jgi:hypothetical protein
MLFNKQPEKYACRCGKTEWQYDTRVRLNTYRMTCYCKDCQAYARYLDPENPAIDVQGGTAIAISRPSDLRFTKGAENLAASRISDKGPYRWHTSCCRTAIGNTLTKPDPAFISAIVTSSKTPQRYGPVLSVRNSASGTNAPPDRGELRVKIRFLRFVYWAKLTGRVRRTPFFAADGTPVVQAHIMTEAEKAAAYGS